MALPARTAAKLRDAQAEDALARPEQPGGVEARSGGSCRTKTSTTPATSGRNTIPVAVYNRHPGTQGTWQHPSPSASQHAVIQRR
jgi:hypothetical protein